jgi:hypothetical protein
MTAHKPKKLVCTKCGCDFTGCRQALYCPKCRENRNLERAKERQRRVSESMTEEEKERERREDRERYAARRKASRYLPRLDLYAKFVKALPGADDDARLFVGRILPLGAIKRAAPGFFPDGLLIRLEAKDETYTIKGGVLVKYQEGAANA